MLTLELFFSRMKDRKRVAPLLLQAFLISFFFFNLGFPLGAPITYQFKKNKNKNKSKSMRDKTVL